MGIQEGANSGYAAATPISNLMDSPPSKGGLDTSNPVDGTEDSGSDGVDYDAIPWEKIDWSRVDQKKINLDALEGFRNHKSMTDHRIAQEAARAAHFENELVRISQELEAKALEGKDDYTVLQHQYDKVRKENELYRRERAERRNEESRQRFIDDVKKQFGVDISDKQFNDAPEALVIVAKEQARLRAEASMELDKYRKRDAGNAAAEEDAPDLGGGGEIMGQTLLQKQFDDAMGKRNGSLADRVSRKAAEEGVQIDRFAWTRNRNLREAV